MKKPILLLVLFCSAIFVSQAQVAINADGSSPNISAMLDIKSDTSGLLIPRMTMALRNAINNPATGLMIFQTDNIPGYYYYNGSSWKSIGSDALSIDNLTDGKTGGNSVFLGANTGASDDGTDNRNIAIGVDAFILNNTGFENTAIGYSALYSNTGGYRNAAVGYGALYDNTTAHENTAYGNFALSYNTTGNFNTGIGYQANDFNQTGSNNTIIGYQAGTGTAPHNKTGNIFLGFKAGYNETGSDKLYIENSDNAAPLIYGEFDNDLVRINGDLDVTGSFSANIGIDGLTDGKTGGNSVFLGSGAGINDDGTDNKNVAVGTNALNTNASGDNNVATGYMALYSNTDGSYNTATGHTTLVLNSHGEYNTASGYEALYQNTEGDRNTAVGALSLYSNATGGNNTVNGYASSYNNTLGSYNTVSGSRANYYNQQGFYNTIIGYQAGFGTAMHTKSGNIFLGYKAGYSEHGSDKLYIENSDNAAPLIYGEFDNDLVRINGDLDVTGSFSANIGIDGLTDGKTGGNSVFLGSGAGANDDGTTNNNVAVGYDAFKTNISGYYNTANGCLAMFSNTEGHNNSVNGAGALYSNIGGDWNTASGFMALYANTEGNANTAIGYYSLISNTTGYSNVSIGASSLNRNTDRSNLVAVGDSALFNNGIGVTASYMATKNTAIGSKTLFSNTRGNRNTAIGFQSLYSNIDGSQNTVSGVYASYSNTVGHSNTVSGFEANYYNETGSDNTIIGYNAGKGTALHNKSGNVFIGYAAGYSETGDDKLYIENSSISSPLIYGEFDNNLVRINGDLDVTGSFSGMEINDLSDGKTGGISVFLGLGAGYSDDGTDNENIAVGDSALYTNTTGVGNTAIGTYSLYSNTGGGGNTANGYKTLFANISGLANTANGYKSLYYNTEDFNTATGYNSLYNNTIGYSNTANGHKSLYYNNGGFQNTANGEKSLYKNNTGKNNTADGYKALYSNTIGYSNVAVGVKSLYYNTYNHNLVAIGDSALYNNGVGASGSFQATNNTALGSKALFSNTTGYNNTAAGNSSLYNNTAGWENTAFGSKSLYSSSSGYYNTAFGTWALYLNTSGDYNVAIGAAADYHNEGGNKNTVIGYEAGYGPTGHTKSGNIFLGYQAGKNETGDNKLYIENSNSSSPLIYGEFDNNFITIYGNLGVGTKSFGGGTKTLALYNGIAPSSSILDGVLLYSQNASSELKVRDEAGNITTLSPHNFSMTTKSEPMAWSYYSENTEAGQKINVDMLKAIRLIEKVTGEKLAFVENIEGGVDITDTDESTIGIIQQQQQDIEELKKMNTLLLMRIEKLEKK